MPNPSFVSMDEETAKKIAKAVGEIGLGENLGGGVKGMGAVDIVPGLATLMGPAKQGVQAAAPKLARYLQKIPNLIGTKYTPNLMENESAYGITSKLPALLQESQVPSGRKINPFALSQMLMEFDPRVTDPAKLSRQGYQMGGKNTFAHEPIHAAYYAKGDTGLPPDKYIEQIGAHMFDKATDAERRYAQAFMKSYMDAGSSPLEAMGEWIVETMANRARTSAQRMPRYPSQISGQQGNLPMALPYGGLDPLRQYMRQLMQVGQSSTGSKYVNQGELPLR